MTSLFGTSASAPVFGGMISLINAARASQGKNPVGFINPTLWAYSGKTTPSPNNITIFSVYNDILSGNNKCAAYSGNNPSNAFCCDSGFYTTTGWDPVTGFGSINFGNLSALLETEVLTDLSYTDDDGNNTATVSMLAIIVLVIIGSILVLMLVVGIIYVLCCIPKNTTSTSSTLTGSSTTATYIRTQHTEVELPHYNNNMSSIHRSVHIQPSSEIHTARNPIATINTHIRSNSNSPPELSPIYAPNTTTNSSSDARQFGTYASPPKNNLQF